MFNWIMSEMSKCLIEQSDDIQKTNMYTAQYITAL